jgi:hypothetical protein
MIAVASAPLARSVARRERGAVRTAELETSMELPHFTIAGPDRLTPTEADDSAFAA